MFVCVDNERDVTLEDVLVFATGSSQEPPLGFQYPPSLHFLHAPEDIRPSDILFPTANTCTLVLRLPVCSAYDDFVLVMDGGIRQSPCFGMT